MFDVHVPLKYMVQQLVIHIFECADVGLQFLGESLIVILVYRAQLLIQVAYIPS